MKLDIENIFLSLLGSTDKLKWYLRENINVVNYMSSLLFNLTISTIPKPKRREMLKDFNVDRILGILKRQRPDLYKVLINYPDGRRWLGEQINGFRRKFL